MSSIKSVRPIISCLKCSKSFQNAFCAKSVAGLDASTVGHFQCFFVRCYGAKIYTRTGDKGSSSLFTGERRPKSNLVFNTLGDVDELSSNIGMCREVLMDSWQHDNYKAINDILEKIQCTLQDVNSCVATPLTSASEKMLQRTKFDADLVVELEEWIDTYTEDLPQLKNFILPSGGKSSCSLHICRSICRRAERKVAQLFLDQHIDEAVAKYVNRLSDLLFTLARHVALMEGQAEVVYRKPKKLKKKEEVIDAENVD